MDRIHMKAKKAAMSDLHSMMSDVEKRSMMKGGEPSFSVSPKHGKHHLNQHPKQEEPEVGETMAHERGESSEEEASEHPEMTSMTGERDGKATHFDRADPGDDVGEHDEAGGHHAESIDKGLEKFLLRKGSRGHGGR